jgi:hypothetical protein
MALPTDEEEDRLAQEAEDREEEEEEAEARGEVSAGRAAARAAEIRDCVAWSRRVDVLPPLHGPGSAGRAPAGCGQSPVTLRGEPLQGLGSAGSIRRELVRQALSMPLEAAGSTSVYAMERRLLAVSHLRISVASLFVSLIKSFRMYLRAGDQEEEDQEDADADADAEAEEEGGGESAADDSSSRAAGAVASTVSSRAAERVTR